MKRRRILTSNHSLRICYMHQIFAENSNNSLKLKGAFLKGLMLMTLLALC